MDHIIKNYKYAEFGELNYCFQNGIMYQRDMVVTALYQEDYFAKYRQYEGSEIARKLNLGRTQITEKYCTFLLDIGIGSGEFIKQSSVDAKGYDINPVAIAWLQEKQLYCEPKNFCGNGWCFWDSLEHIPDPSKLLSLVSFGSFVFMSLPIFDDLLAIRKSKHYRPGEHLYYFTTNGLIGWMKEHGFETIEISDFETVAGRENILSFVFQKY